MKILVLLICIFTLPQIAFTGSKNDKVSFKSMKAKAAHKKFSKAKEKIVKEYKKKMIKILTSYQKELKVSMKRVMRGGKLKEANLIQDELTKIEKELDEFEEKEDDDHDEDKGKKSRKKDKDDD